MPYWFCEKCRKPLGDKEHYSGWYESPYPATPGPFIAGHMLNNPNLPIVGIQLNRQNGFKWEYCSTCNTAAIIKRTKEDDEYDRKKIRIIIL